jgi:DNA-binding MurR/RpiR family transcriptional regulator
VTRTYESLRGEISAQYRQLSGRLQQIAQFALDNPSDMALETVAVVAERAGVQRSAIIRFAKAFGFDGFTEMQGVFRARLVLVERAPHYRKRIRQLQAEANQGLDDPGHVLDHFVESGITALQKLREEVSPEKLDQALRLLRKSRTIDVVGQRRAFSVAAYLVYAFAQLGRSCHLIDNVGWMFEQQTQEVSKGDTVVAVSFHPHATETVEVADRAAQAGVPVIAITDDPLSPLAAVSFEVQDEEVKGFRSLTAIMTLAVTLVVALGQSLESRDRGAGRSRAPATAPAGLS